MPHLFLTSKYEGVSSLILAVVNTHVHAEFWLLEDILS